MSTDLVRSHRRLRIVTYALLGLLLAIGIVWGLFAFHQQHESRDASAKADRLIAAAHDAGIPTPLSKAQVVRLFGTDGGVVCQDPGSALSTARAYQGLSNGAAGPGQRGVIGDADLVVAERLVIRTYCPEEADAFERAVDDLRLGDTANP